MAILLVVGFHAGVRGFGGGFVGVDVFFVLSGYLITRVIVDEVVGTGGFGFRAFYARRIRRLLPTAVVVGVVALLASTLLLGPLELSGIVGAAVANAGYVSNFWFADQATNYFANEASGNPFLHTWSLAVEEQFYLVWPLVLVAALALGRRVQREWSVLVGAVAVLAVLSFALAVHQTGAAPNLAFYGSPARAWEFAVGALALLVPWPVGRRTAVVTSSGGMAMVLAATLFFDGVTRFPGVAAALPVLGTAAVLVAGEVPRHQGVLRLLAIRPMQSLGRLSYPLYLWHWPLLVLAPVALGGLDLSRRLALMVLALGLSAATVRLVERPVRFHPFLVRYPVRNLALGGGLTVVALVAALGARSIGTSQMDAPSQRRFAVAAAELPEVYSAGCATDVAGTSLPARRCVFGDKSSSETIVLLGDSHAGHWFPALNEVAQERGWRLVALIKGSCPTSDTTIFSVELGRAYEECDTWRAAAMTRITELEPFAVVMANATNLYVGSAPWQVDPDTWTEGMTSSMDRMGRSDIESVLIADTPRPGFDVPACLSRQAAKRPFAGGCTYRLDDSGNDAALAADAEAVAETELAGLLDFNGLVCASSICPAREDGVAIYKDGGHLSVPFVEQHADAVGSSLGAALGSIDAARTG